jgi:hypothetical protein
MATAVSVLKDVFDFNMGRADFEQRLRYFLWEGRENYDLRLKLRRALSDRAGSERDHANEFDLPEWGKLVELVRGYLQAPEALAILPFIVKEIAFRTAVSAQKPEADRHIVKLLSSNNRARQFIFAATSYLVQATSLPRAFQRDMEVAVNSLMD